MKYGATVVVDRMQVLKESLAVLEGKQTMVGFPESTTERTPEPGEPAGLTNAALAYIQNNGAPEAGIPAREFMISGLEPVMPRITRVLEGGARKAVGGDPAAVDIALTKAGLIGESAIKDKIISGPFAPLAASTIAARERMGREPPFSPLIVSGQLKNAVTHVLRKVIGAFR